MCCLIRETNPNKRNDLLNYSNYQLYYFALKKIEKFITQFQTGKPEINLVISIQIIRGFVQTLNVHVSLRDTSSPWRCVLWSEESSVHTI